MATQGQLMVLTFKAEEDLSANASQYVAIAMNDGKVANNSEEASGILQDRPESGDFGLLSYTGEMKFRAGSAISKGDQIKVTTSGYLISAGSYDMGIGECILANVSSGMIGSMLASFPGGQESRNYSTVAVTPKINVPAGAALDLSDFDMAATGEAADVVFPVAVNSGTELTDACAMGVIPALFADASSAGDALTVASGGAFLPAVSGDYIVGKTLEASVASGGIGDITFTGVGYYLSV